MTKATTPEKKHIAFVKVDQEIYKNIPPLGLLYLGDALKKAGYSVSVHHILEQDIKRTSRIILEEDPLFVGFSVVTGWNIKPAAALSRLLKQENRFPVVWGNVHPSHLPEQCLGEDYIDFVCIGEGEETVVELAAALENDTSFDRIKGIGFKTESGEIRINPGRPLIEDLDQYEVDWSLLDIERYIVPAWGLKRALRVIASRGCPFQCTFCYNASFNQGRWRTHSADYMVKNLQQLAERYHIEAFYFNDDNLFVRQGWAWEIIERLNLPYYASVRPGYIDSEFASRLAKTRCKEVLIGFESGSDAVLENIIKKGSTSEEHFAALENLKRFPEVKITGSFITALPEETREDLEETVRMICGFLEIHPNLRIILAFYRPLPGTELYDLSLSKGFQPPEDTEGWHDYDCLANSLDLPWMDKESNVKIEALCRAMDILAALYKFDILFLKPLVRDRILEGKYEGRLMNLLNTIRIRYAFGDGRRPMTSALRKLVNQVKSWKRLE